MAKTTKPISSISYNTTPFLKETLNTLIICKVITYYEFIEHLPDIDDKKSHKHLYIIPNKSLDLASFADYFIEKDPTNEKPLRCMPFRISNKYGDWYWYGLHDKDYLRAKELERHTFYTDANIVTSDADFHNVLVCENPLIHYATMSDTGLREYVCNSCYNAVPLRNILTSGLVPLGKVHSVVLLYNAIMSTITGVSSNVIPSVSDIKKMKANQLLNKITEVNIDEDLPFDDDLF